MQRQVIEHAGIPVGIAIPESGKLRFIAVKFHVIDLDNESFATVGELNARIRAHVGERHAIAA